MILGGLVLLGFSAAMITIPLLPEMLHSVEQKFPLLKGSEELNNVLSGYFNACMGIGEAAGPISAGLLVSEFGFRGASDLLGSILLFFTLLFFLINGNISLILPKCPWFKEDDDCFIRQESDKHMLLQKRHTTRIPRPIYGK